MPKTNVILFGGSGSGKSSLVNMLSNTVVTGVSNAARGCTLESDAFEVNIHGQSMTLWDTAGLDEGEGGSVLHSDAIIKLYQLIRNLRDGVSLLVFVMRMPRVTSSVPENWKLFRDIICQNRVPIIIVITGFDRGNGDQWWRNNEETFQQYGISPAGHACITCEGQEGGYSYGEEYERSKRVVRELMLSYFLNHPWKVPAADWFKSTFVTMFIRRYLKGWTWLRKIWKENPGNALQDLINVGGMSAEEAIALAEELRDDDEARALAERLRAANEARSEASTSGRWFGWPRWLRSHK
ncbi:hypothetical protein P691DRAFT_788977 [Macrolepiota fuliginosa MF-IS2]|uniref:G domain-containing protein n=1 Tax=Macrolepiota fuliginosa MF-IS2 TaxID=1400762 RepID=A0A9P5X362_9AGAR|nr:hypothetical protein P691DRAFT_788977 [Macrolepiota fuliginosa MF-IS2]